MVLDIGGMTCDACARRIENELRKTKGIHEVQVSYQTNSAKLGFDEETISYPKIRKIVENIGYQVRGEIAESFSFRFPGYRLVALAIIVIALFILLQNLGLLNLLVPSQLAQTNMAYGMLFVVGLLTSIHCVAMCGGINLSQSIPKTVSEVSIAASRAGSSANATQRTASQTALSTLRSPALYNLGRVISYTLIGALVGALGSVLTFLPALQGALKLLAGLLMVVMGANLLGFFPFLRRFSLRLPKNLGRKVEQHKAQSKSPLYIGLLNGLMPCGPLQAMQLYALSTGSALTGALSMLLFALGTVPLMFGLGALAAALGQKFRQRVMTVGAVLVVVLGLALFSQGWSLSGLRLPAILGDSLTVLSSSPAHQPTDNVVIINGEQVITSKLQPGSYPDITVQAGIPVRWVIEAPDGSINGCNNRMIVSEYAIEHRFRTGENVIEFDPTKAGHYEYSCWMGMIHGTITVI